MREIGAEDLAVVDGIRQHGRGAHCHGAQSMLCANGVCIVHRAMAQACIVVWGARLPGRGVEFCLRPVRHGRCGAAHEKEERGSGKTANGGGRNHDASKMRTLGAAPKRTSCECQVRRRNEIRVNNVQRMPRQGSSWL
jgi:hypothetical protein